MSLKKRSSDTLNDINDQKNKTKKVSKKNKKAEKAKKNKIERDSRRRFAKKKKQIATKRRHFYPNIGLNHNIDFVSSYHLSQESSVFKLR